MKNFSVSFFLTALSPRLLLRLSQNEITSPPRNFSLLSPKRLNAASEGKRNNLLSQSEKRRRTRKERNVKISPLEQQSSSTTFMNISNIQIKMKLSVLTYHTSAQHDDEIFNLVRSSIRSLVHSIEKIKIFPIPLLACSLA
jgi:hypothetical protein